MLGIVLSWDNRVRGTDYILPKSNFTTFLEWTEISILGLLTSVSVKHWQERSEYFFYQVIDDHNVNFHIYPAKCTFISISEVSSSFVDTVHSKLPKLMVADSQNFEYLKDKLLISVLKFIKSTHSFQTVKI